MTHDQFYDQMGLCLKRKRLYQLWPWLASDYHRETAKLCMLSVSREFYEDGKSPELAAEYFFDLVVMSIAATHSHFERAHA